MYYIELQYTDKSGDTVHSDLRTNDLFSVNEAWAEYIYHITFVKQTNDHYFIVKSFEGTIDF